MRLSPQVLAAAASLAGALVGALVSLQLGVVELGGDPDAARSSAGAVTPTRTPSTRDRPTRARPSRAPAPVLPAEELRERRATVEALGVLRRWDDRRARAWARGDPALLRDLYTAGSVAGRRDAALLTRYAERGWAVEGLVPQVLSAAAPTLTGDRVRLRVSERYRDLTVSGAGAGWGPAGDPTGRAGAQERVVTLVRSPTGWLVDSVRAS